MRRPIDGNSRIRTQYCIDYLSTDSGIVRVNVHCLFKECASQVKACPQTNVISLPDALASLWINSSEFIGPHDASVGLANVASCAFLRVSDI